jgi:hypothetical protein
MTALAEKTGQESSNPLGSLEEDLADPGREAAQVVQRAGLPEGPVEDETYQAAVSESSEQTGGIRSGLDWVCEGGVAEKAHSGGVTRATNAQDVDGIHSESPS